MTPPGLPTPDYSSWPTVPMIAKRLGIGRAQVVRLLRRGVFAGWRPHPRGRWRVNPEVLEKALAPVAKQVRP